MTNRPGGSYRTGTTAPAGDNSTKMATTAYADRSPLVNFAADGCCRVSVASTTTLTLKPYGGNTLWIGGQACTIPSGGVTTPSQTGLTASTLYYVYATASGGAVNALVFSTTGHVTGSDGREYLSNSGAAVTTSRLVGMAYTNTAAAPFLDSLAFRGIANWFNRSNKLVATSGASSTSSTTYIEFAQLRSYALSWGDEAFIMSIAGDLSNSTVNALCYISAWNGGASGSVTGPSVDGFSSIANADLNLSVSTPVSPTEGPMILSPAVKTNTGTMSITLFLSYIVRI